LLKDYFNVILTVMLIPYINHILTSIITFITPKSDLKKVFNEKIFKNPHYKEAPWSLVPGP
jgi:hypothetical protein